MSNHFELINCFNNKISVSFTSISNKTEIIHDTRESIENISANIHQLAIPIQNHTDTVKWINTSGVYKDCDGIVTNLNYK